MSVSFLDKSGLSYFWGKIKAWCNSLFALDSAVVHKTDSISETVTGEKTFTSNVVISNSDPILVCKDTDIVKGTVPSVNNYNKAISIYDNNNVLCACIEHGYSVNRSNMLSFNVYSGITNDSTYSEAAAFSVGVSFANGVSPLKQILARTNIWIVNSFLSKGTQPSADRNFSVYFCDSTSLDWSNSVLGEVVCRCTTGNIISMQLRAFENVANSSNYATLACIYETNTGRTYGTAPTPRLDATGTEIITASWISQKCLPTTLYLDAVNGNDNNNGFTSSSAKKTIASLESMVNNSYFVPAGITVNVASGTYDDTIQGSFHTFLYYKFSSGAIINGVYVYGPRYVRLAGTFRARSSFFAACGGLLELGIGGLDTTITFNGVDIPAILRAQVRGIIQAQYGAKSITIALTGTCKFTNVIGVESSSLINLGYGGRSVAWTGSASTGRKYSVSALSILLGKGSDANIPGSGTYVDPNGVVG